ncbi:dephospho-CoA kinase [Spirillospora sp. NPDC046719]
MLKVGLTGGIGSGKSEVSARLDERGAVVIDADKIAREVVEPGTPGLAAVAAEFGEEVLLPSGALDRERVGRIVFADADRLAALNAIVHPLVGERMQELMDAAPADAIVVYDVPLLAENGLAGMYDAVVVVDAPEETQLDRLTSRRGMTEEDARARMANQATREQRRAVATHVIDNSGTLDDLKSQVDALWETLTRQAADKTAREQT